MSGAMSSTASGERPVALVTGAQRGIGRAIALELAGRGFDVAAVDLSETEALAETVTACRAAGVRAEGLAADVADLAAHGALLDAVEARLGPLAALVNNAGVSVLSRGDLLDVTPESFDRCLAVNTRGTFFLTQAAAKRMLAAPTPGWHRSIVNITSSNARGASILRGEYCVSKAGLSMASTLFALRLAADGIGVYEVQPGIIETEMTAPSKARHDATIASGATAVPRWGRPEEVARVVATMATGQLPYTVGLPVPVDGGLLIQKF